MDLFPSASNSDFRSPYIRVDRGITLCCCCNREDCISLKKNCAILETVEKDVHTAAKLGQALLARHEAYMADVKRDRFELTSRIERLEMANRDLETENTKKIDENRSLLDQLESLNSTISESDSKIKSLEANLLSSQQTVRRLEGAASRADDVERHISLLEDEQDKLYQELQSTKDESRTYAQRFKEAQRGIYDMQDQLERIESEARIERERHAEVVERIERQREIDKQLDMAAGRLKGAAASKSLRNHDHGNNIVGHFVRDLLDDNASLQMTIAELRKMLFNSNDEVQSLRDQLLYHQPLPQEATSGPLPVLRSELGTFPDSPKLSQELHVHHHYHVTSKQDSRKFKKKRQGLLSGAGISPTVADTHTPLKYKSLVASPSPPNSSLSNFKASGRANGRSKTYHARQTSCNSPSEMASSAPSSPQFDTRDAMFDHGFSDNEPPTSPTTSLDPTSPIWPSHGKRLSVASVKSFQSVSMSLWETSLETPCGKPSAQTRNHDDTIHEEEEDDMKPSSSRSSPCSAKSAIVEDPDLDHVEASLQNDISSHPTLRRPRSHDSIISLTGGLDIHTLKSRPGQMLLRPFGGADAVVTGAIARPTLSRVSGKRSELALRDQFASVSSPGTIPSQRSPTVMPESPLPSERGSRSFGRWTGWRPWGVNSSPLNACRTADNHDREKDRVIQRAHGINQPGLIPGFQQYWAAQKRKGAPAQVTTQNINREALIEVLQEGEVTV